VRAAVEARRVALAVSQNALDLQGIEQTLQQRKRDLADRRARLDSACEELQAVLDASTAPAEWKGPSSGTLRAQIASLEQLGELRRRLDSDADRKAQAQVAQAKWRALQERAAQRLIEVLAQVRAEAESVVNRYMPLGMRASLVLDGTTFSWCVSDTDGRVRGPGVWCGSEQGALMVALSIAWTEGVPLRVLLLDDPDLGLLAADAVPQVLTAVREAVESGVLTQAIVALSRPDEVPPGWVHVNR